MSDPKKGLGGGPTRNTTLPTAAAERKKFPIATGFFDYFPDAIAAIANLSYRGSQQHNPGKPLFWDRSKSTDEDDTALRHFLQRGTLDNDGVRHTVKACWRMLAFLQKEIEAEQASKEPGQFVAMNSDCHTLKFLGGKDSWVEGPCRGPIVPSMGMCEHHSARYLRGFGKESK